MNNYDITYISLLESILSEGYTEKNRTGIDAITIPSAYIKHDMNDGFPLLTVRKLPYKSIKVELEGFIKGISSKKWYQDRGCKFWNEWANPQKVKYGNDDDSKNRMLDEDDLGIIYGNNWRDFHCPNAVENYGLEGGFYRSRGVDQLKAIVKTLKNNPNDRRMLCLSWNPLALDYAALPACHVLWRVMVINNKLHLSWYQRSVDAILGLPANFSSYSTLLHLLSLGSGIEIGTVSAHLDCVHIYSNQLVGARELLKRDTNIPLPKIKTEKFTSIFDWEYKDTELLDYNPQAPIKFEVAV